jgi:hypothetical protein
MFKYPIFIRNNTHVAISTNRAHSHKTNIPHEGQRLKRQRIHTYTPFSLLNSPNKNSYLYWDNFYTNNNNFKISFVNLDNYFNIFKHCNST